MALKVGDLYVSLTANTQKLQKQLNGAARKIESFGRNLKGLGKDASDMSNMVAAAVGAAVAVAASKDAQVKKQVEDLKNASTAVAIEVARLALPVLQQMADTVGRVVTLFRQLTPEQRAMATQFIQIALGVSAVGMAAVKLEPAFKLAATAVRFVASSMGLLSASTLPVLVAVALLIGIAGLVREAWDQNLGGIQEKFAAVWGWVSEKATWLGNKLGGVGEYIWKAFQKYLIKVAEDWAGVIRLMVSGAAGLARALHIDGLVDVDGWEEFGKTVADWVAQLPTDSGLDALKDDTLEVLAMMKSGVGKMTDDMRAKLEGFLKLLPANATKVGKFKDLTDKATEDFGRLRADKMEASFRALRGRGGNLRDSMEMAGALNVPAALEKFNGEALSSIKGIEDVRDFLHKLGAKGGEAEKYLSAWEKWNEDQRKAAQHVDRLRADRAPLESQLFLAGASTFGEGARRSGVTSKMPEWLDKFDGSRLKTLADFEDLEDSLAQVRDLNPVVREWFNTTRQAYLDAEAAAKELQQASEAAFSGFRDQVVGAMGKVSGVIQAATGPMAQAGGEIGALVAVIFELVKGSAGFQRLTESLDGILTALGDALGQLLVPVADLVSALAPVVQAVTGLIAPLVPLVSQVLQPLLPVFVVLGTLLGALAPIIQLVAKVLELALLPVMYVLEKALRGVFATMQGVAIVILGIVVGVLNVWNGIVSAIQSVFSVIAGFEIAGQRPLAFLGEWAAGLESAKASTQTYEDQLAAAVSMTWDSALTTAQSFGTAAAAADELASGMTNAASGFKVDLARYNATNTGTTARFPADLGSSAGALVGDTYVTIVSNDPEAIWSKMEAIRRRGNFQKGRGTLGGLPAFGS